MGLPVSKYDWWILAAAFALFAAWLITRLPVLRTLVLAAALGYLLRRVWVGYLYFGNYLND